MATLDTHKAVTELQEAGASEPLARATVNVVEEGVARGTENFVTEEMLHSALNRSLLTFGLTFGLGMLAANIAIAGTALAIAQWMFG